MSKITKLEVNDQIPFNRIAVDRELRLIKNKLNEIIDAVNELSDPIYADDFEDDELEEMSKANDDGDYVFSPDEAKKILSDRIKERSRKGDMK